MKLHHVFILLILLLGVSCAQDDAYSPNTYDDESAVYYDEDSDTFRNILMILMPYITEGGEKYYVVTDSLSEITVNINGQTWGVFSSIAKDTASINYSYLNNFTVSDFPVKYSVIAPVGYDQPDTLSTAGEFADLLNAYFTLSPGYYMCDVVSFQIKQADGTQLTINPLITEPLQIEAGMESVYLGEFEIPLN